MTTCPQCSRTFQGRLHQKFCSRSCRTTWWNLHKPKVYRNCLVCEKKFKTQNNYIRRGGGKYCSKSCERKAHALDIAKRRKFPLSKEKLIKLYWTDGLNYKQIAGRLGVSFAAIEYWMKKFGICARDRSTVTKLRWRELATLRKLSLARRKHPNSIEQKVIDLIDKNHLPFAYNTRFRMGRWLPDFIAVDGSNRLIEIFGEYWHTKRADSPTDTEEGRKEAFSKLGYSVLIIWEHELEDEGEVLDKIRKFGPGGEI